MAQKYVEVERKYDAAPDFTLPELIGLPKVASISEPEKYLLVANYFDTDDLRLASQGITLRRRRGGADAGWHLKIPAGPDTKSELRAPLGRAQTPPARLAALVCAHTRGAPLRPVAKLETDRTVLRLLDAEGRTLAEVADDAVIGEVLDHVIDDSKVSAWREIEVELVEGTPELLKAAGKRLRKAGARRAGSSSKLGRLLGDAVPGAPVAGRPGTAGAEVLAYLAAQRAAILTYDPKARLAEFDAVHKMRVATRRIRSTLRDYGAILDRNVTGEVQSELKWLADVLGEVRDLEVLRMRFTERLDRLDEDLRLKSATDEDRSTATGPTAARGWLVRLGKEEEAAYRRLNATLRQPRYFAFLDTLDRLLAEPPLTARADRRADTELPKLVKRAWRRLEKGYAKIDRAADTDLARHEARKLGKRARYAAEVAVRALGEPAARVVADARDMQDVLGGFQDGVVAMAYLRATAERVTDPAEAFSLGALHGAERCAAVESLTHIESTWRRARPPAFGKPRRS